MTIYEHNGRERRVHARYQVCWWKRGNKYHSGPVMHYYHRNPAMLFARLGVLFGYSVDVIDRNP